MSLVLSTLEKLEAARTDADCYRVSVELMRYATPSEIKALAETFVTESPFRTWLVDLNANVTLHRSVPASFVCRHFSPSICLYTNGGAAKTLVLGFCGNLGLLQVPVAVFLQYFPDESFDVLVLRDPELKGFSAGIHGYADSFSRLIERLRAEFHVDRYENVRCFGCSSGAAAALAAGALLQASALVGFCGKPPSLSSTRGKTAASKDLENHIRAVGGSAEGAFAVFGAKSSKDVHGAQGLAQLMDLRLVPISDVADHNVIGPLHRRGDLAATLQLVGLL